MNQTSAPYEENISEIDRVGFSPIESSDIKSARCKRSKNQIRM